MEKWSSPGAGSVLALLALSIPSLALEAPAGAELPVRLKTKVSTQSSKAGDAVEAVVIAPLMAGGQFAIPAGATVRGSVVKVAQSAKPDERSVLVLNFTGIEVGGDILKIAALVADVDNARERVDEQGQINGILASETITGRLDAGIESLGQRYAGFADVLSTAKNAVLKAPESGITYDAGVEMSLRLTAPLELKAALGAGPAEKLEAVKNEAALVDLASREPYQTVAENPPKPSDVTNIMLIGTEEQIQKVFAAAGWKSAAALNAQAKFETVRALAENRSYNEAPVSVLLLDGKPPDAVFEKMNNTFARRHHLRIWRRPATFQGQPVWAVAATHDIGISFSEQNRTFIHRIDPLIDRERAKVVNDLI
ncbi:MAG: LssY C-terminal domain-containing protein [Acidobacteriia bacterium]|nr:LssY C-terminal domain-containing protein [Terriglobia bacterium]